MQIKLVATGVRLVAALLTCFAGFYLLFAVALHFLERRPQS